MLLEKLRRKKKNYDPNHPGRTEELKAGTVLPDGTIVGQTEAMLFFDVFEKDLSNRLAELSDEEIKEKFSKELAWYQRVGNFRKRQKCKSLQKMQKSFGLPQTSPKECISNIMKVEDETWGI